MLNKIKNMFKPWHKIPNQYSEVDTDKIITFDDLRILAVTSWETYKVRKGTDAHKKLEKYLKD